MAIHDEGDVVIPPNTFDLHATGLRHLPKAGGGYDVVQIDPLVPEATRLESVSLDDDDTVGRSLSFGFTRHRPIDGVRQSDGNTVW